MPHWRSAVAAAAAAASCGLPVALAGRSSLQLEAASALTLEEQELHATEAGGRCKMPSRQFKLALVKSAPCPERPVDAQSGPQSETMSDKDQPEKCYEIKCKQGKKGGGNEGVKRCVKAVKGDDEAFVWVDHDFAGAREELEDDLPLCVEPYRLEIVDASNGEPIPNAKVAVTELKGAKDARGRTYEGTTNELGHISFPIFWMKFEVVMDAAEAGFVTLHRTIQRMQACAENQEACQNRLALTKRLEGISLQDDCTFRVKDSEARNLNLQMRAVLEWQSNKDLNLWARNFDCFNDVRLRHKCKAAFTTKQLPPDGLKPEDQCLINRVKDEREEEQRACGAMKCKEDGCTDYHANQFAKWLDEESEVIKVDRLQYRVKATSGRAALVPGAERWPDASTMTLDYANKAFGPETITFQNPAPGTYQFVVNQVDLGDSRPEPHLMLYLGADELAFECQLNNPQECFTRSNNLWNVGSLRVEHAGEVMDEEGRPVGEQAYRVVITDSRATLPLAEMGLPTTEEKATVSMTVPADFGTKQETVEYFKSTHPDYTQAYLDTLVSSCTGECKPAPGPRQAAAQSCFARCSSDRRKCAAPIGIPNAAEVACAEGSCVDFGGECTPVCQDGYEPSVPKLKCEVGAFTFPYTFKCVPATCNVPGSNGLPGSKCECNERHTGTIRFEGGKPTEDSRCEPIKCDKIKNSNGKAGDECACADGFTGEIRFYEGQSHGTCHPEVCNLDFTNKKPGPECACESGYSGKITWKGNVPGGECLPVRCDVENSNRMPGKACKCNKGYSGWIEWLGEKLHPDSKCVRNDILKQEKEALLEQAKQELARLMAMDHEGCDAMEDDAARAQCEDIAQQISVTEWKISEADKMLQEIPDETPDLDEQGFEIHAHQVRLPDGGDLVDGAVVKEEAQRDRGSDDVDDEPVVQVEREVSEREPRRKTD